MLIHFFITATTGFLMLLISFKTMRKRNVLRSTIQQRPPLRRPSILEPLYKESGAAPSSACFKASSLRSAY